MNLRQIRVKVIDQLFISAPILCAIATLAVAIDEIVAGRFLLLMIYLPAYTLIMVGFFAGREHYRFRGAILLTVIFAVGATEFLLFGISGLGFLLFFAYTIFAPLLLGYRHGRFALAISIVAVALIALLWSNGVVPATESVRQVSTRIQFWLSRSITFTLMSIGSFFFVASLLRELSSSISSADSHLKTIGVEVRERMRLEEERAELEEQLRQTGKMEAAGLLASSVAHEFNNTIQAIHGYAELALTELDDTSPAKKDIDGILSSANRSARLIEQLLTFGRRERSNLAEITLDAIVDQSRRLVEQLIGTELKVVIRTKSETATIEADATAVEQIIINLCLNARDAMPNGGTLTIDTRIVELDDAFCGNHPWALSGAYVRLRVADTGQGIQPHVLKRMFEPFYTTKQANRGTGLGLSTVYGIVKRHEALLNVDSQPGRGTTFDIFFSRIR